MESKYKTVAVVILLTLLIGSVQPIAGVIDGWAILKEKQKEGSEYSSEQGEIIYLIESQLKNTSTDRLILGRVSFKMKDTEGYLHGPCKSLLPPEKSNFTVLEPGAVLWSELAFSAPRGITPTQLIIGPGQLFNVMDLRVPILTDKPEALLEQSANSVETHESIDLCNLNFTLEHTEMNEGELKVKFKANNPTQKSVNMGINNCPLSEPFVIGKYGKTNNELSGMLWSSKYFPSSMRPGETVRIQSSFRLEKLSPPYYLGLYYGISPNSLKQFFWKIYS